MTKGMDACLGLFFTTDKCAINMHSFRLLKSNNLFFSQKSSEAEKNLAREYIDVP